MEGHLCKTSEVFTGRLTGGVGVGGVGVCGVGVGGGVYQKI